MALTRSWLTPLVDDSGSGTDGSPIDKDLFTDFCDDIDASIAADVGLDAGNNYINDTSNAQMTVGLTINQGAADNEILALKSSDVTHGVTTVTETDTYALLKKGQAAAGGLELIAVNDAGDGTAQALILRGIAGTAGGTGKSTSAVGHVSVVAQVASGTGVADIGANTNIFAARNNATTRFILDADGDSHQDVGVSWTNYDSHNDVAVLNLLSAYVTRPDDPIRALFGEWLLQSRDTLERLRLVTFNDNGHHFVNMSRLTMLLVGAVRQLGARLDRLEQRMLTP